MSDLLSGPLVEAVARSICVYDYDTCYAHDAHRTQARNAIAVVSEALRNPTDEQVRVIAWRTQQQQGWNGTLEQRVRAVLAAAGGDDE